MELHLHMQSPRELIIEFSFMESLNYLRMAGKAKWVEVKALPLRS